MSKTIVYAVCAWHANQPDTLRDLQENINKLLGERRTGTFTVALSQPETLAETYLHHSDKSQKEK